MNYVLIGDIHSQANKLRYALNFIESNIKNSRVIFLGDIFDTKQSYSNSLSVYKMVREFEDKYNAITIQSNHQDKLIRYYRGNRVELNNGLDKTVKELHSYEDEIYNWLIRQPFGVVFRDNTNLEYRCAHAYFSENVNVLKYDEIFYVKALNLHHKHEFLYGLQDSKRKRVNWWENDNTKSSYVRVSGHYKVLYTNLENKSLVLDSCCGDVDGVLTIYDVNSRKIHQF